MSKFFVLEIGSFDQYKFAHYDVWGKTEYTVNAPTCPACGGCIGMLHGWKDPKVVLKRPKNIGDFIYGAGGCDFLVSQRFLDDYKKSKLSGFERIFSVKVVKMGTKKNSKHSSYPILFGINLKNSNTRVNYSQMGAAWMTPPQKNYCRTCGPGGGGRNGCLKSIDRVVVDEKSWSGEDIFYSINFSGTILLSERACTVIRKGKYTNIEIIPCYEYSYSFY